MGSIWDKRTPKELEAEFDRLFMQDKDMIYNLVWRLTGDREASEDICQKTFLTLHRKLKKVLNHPNPEGWLVKTAHYFVKHHLRGLAYKADHEIPLSDAELFAASPNQGNELEAFLSSLPDWVKEIDRKLLTFHYYYRYNLKEVAAVLGCTHGAVRIRLARLLQKLRETGYGKFE